MKNTPFITIGTKGTSRPVGLMRLKGALALGINHLPWSKNRGYSEANDAHGWVSRNNEPFELWPLDAALKRKFVIQIDGAQWWERAAGQIHTGTAFIKSNWRPSQDKCQPEYVAVISKTWPHGRVERDRVNDGRNTKFLAKMDLSGFFDSSGKLIPPADTIPIGEYYEGDKRQIIGNTYERDPKARAACIAHHGDSCVVCGFNFEGVYGELGKGIIHVHHENQIVKGKRMTDPKKDLKPICPNCHAVIHRHKKCLSIAEVRKALKSRHR